MKQEREQHAVKKVFVDTVAEHHRSGYEHSLRQGSCAFSRVAHSIATFVVQKGYFPPASKTIALKILDGRQCVEHTSPTNGSQSAPFFFLHHVHAIKWLQRGVKMKRVLHYGATQSSMLKGKRAVFQPVFTTIILKDQASICDAGRSFAAMCSYALSTCRTRLRRDRKSGFLSWGSQWRFRKRPQGPE